MLFPHCLNGFRTRPCGRAGDEQREYRESIAVRETGLGKLCAGFFGIEPELRLGLIGTHFRSKRGGWEKPFHDVFADLFAVQREREGLPHTRI